MAPASISSRCTDKGEIDRDAAPVAICGRVIAFLKFARIGFHHQGMPVELASIDGEEVAFHLHISGRGDDRRRLDQ